MWMFGFWGGGGVWKGSWRFDGDGMGWDGEMGFCSFGSGGVFFMVRSIE